MKKITPLICCIMLHSIFFYGMESEYQSLLTKNHKTSRSCCSKRTSKITLYTFSGFVLATYPIVSALCIMYPAENEDLALYEKYVNGGGMLAYPFALGTYVYALKKEIVAAWPNKEQIEKRQSLDAEQLIKSMDSIWKFDLPAEQQKMSTQEEEALRALLRNSEKPVDHMANLIRSIDKDQSDESEDD